MQIETITQLPPEMYDANGLPTDATPADLFDKRVLDGDGNPTGILTDRSFWDSVVPVCHFNDGDLDRVDLYPIVLGQHEPRPRRGVLRPASATDAQRILENLESLSVPYGTPIELHENHAAIKPA